MVVEFGQRVLEHIIGVHLLICSLFLPSILLTIKKKTPIFETI